MIDTFTQISTADQAKPLPAVIARVYSLGRIAAGIPIEAIDDQQQEDLLALLSAPGRYALQVCDDSMVEAGIFNGDVVVIKSQQHARCDFPSVEAFGAPKNRISAISRNS